MSRSLGLRSSTALFHNTSIARALSEADSRKHSTTPTHHPSTIPGPHLFLPVLQPRVPPPPQPPSSSQTPHPNLAYAPSNAASKDDDARPSKIETHKQDSVARAQAGKGEWKPELASQSEQAVQQENNDMTIEEMQKMGEKKAEEGKRPSGSSSSDKA